MGDDRVSRSSGLTLLVQQGLVKHDGASVYIRVDKHGRSIGILVIDAQEERHQYTVVPHPTELGRVALYEDRP